MDISTLKLLLNVARHGSFAAVARTHDIDPSSVSRTVSQAEEELGFRIFQRTTRQMALTEAGETYLRATEAVVEEIELARDDALRLSASPSGTLRLTASVAFGQTCLVPLLEEFRAAFPDLTIELMLTDSNVDLVRERVDLAIRLAPVLSGDLVCTRLMTTHYRVCATPEYLDRAGEPVSPGDLSNHDCLLFSLPEYRSRWLFRDSDGVDREVPVAGHLVISNALALRQATLAGLGPALLADWLVDGDIAMGRLRALLPDHRVTATSFDTAAWLVYPSRSFLPHKVRVAVDFLRARLGGS